MSVTVDLVGTQEPFNVEWLNCTTGEAVGGEVVEEGGRKSLTSPFTGDAVLHIYKP